VSGDIETSSGDQREVEAAAPPRPSRLRRMVRATFRMIWKTLAAVLILGLTGWMALAVYFADTHHGPRTIRAWAVAIVALVAAFVVRPRRYGLAAFVVIFGAVLAWYFSLKPSNDRDWAPDVAKLASAQVDGDRVTIHNVRNFHYRSEEDYDQHWEERTYDLSKLRSSDMMLVYWGSKAIAHGMVSFEFEGDQFLCFSIETRKERGETYSSVAGFFRQYELIYIVGDERDLVRVRTNFRNEDVYLYHVTLSPERSRLVLLSYLKSVNELKDHPEFYNALTTNCVTSILPHVRDAQMQGKFSWDILASGYAARQAYRNGHLDTSLPFEELEARSHVNDKARAAGTGPDFSRRIRQGLPGTRQPAPAQKQAGGGS
jgi:hypothetical protein